MTRWVRLWEDMPVDPKWRTVARRAGRPMPEVIAVFVFMMTRADSNTGSLRGWDDEDVGSALDLDAQAVAAIRNAMQGKVLDGEQLSGWERRQPKRPEDHSTQRVREHRAMKRDETQMKRTGTQGNATEGETEPDTDSETEGEENIIYLNNDDALPRVPAREEPDHRLLRFPEDGSLYGSPWHDIVKKAAPGLDPDRVAQAFRDWCRGCDPPIEFNRPGIMRTFHSWAKNGVKSLRRKHA